MPPKTPGAQDPAPAEAAPLAVPADDADKSADFAPVNMELPDIQSKFATLYTNLEREQRARCNYEFALCFSLPSRSFVTIKMLWLPAAFLLRILQAKA
jgi:hypothetical protein